MADYNIKGVGTAVVDKKLECNFSISSAKFFQMFPDLVARLPSDLTKAIASAIDSKKSEKLDKSLRNDAEDFFSKVEKKAASAPAVEPKKAEEPKKATFATNEASEASTAEKMKSRDIESKQISYADKDTSNGIETYDSKTNKLEGRIFLGENGAEGEVVPVTIVETVHASYEFNAEESKEDDRKVTGEFKIVNPSEHNRIWDIDLTFKKDKGITLEDSLHVQALNPKEEKIVEYTVDEFQEPPLKIKETISTLNDPNTVSYSLAPKQDNVVLFQLNVSNAEAYPLKSVKIVKQVPEGFKDVKPATPSKGTCEVTDEGLVWNIEQLEANEQVTMSLNMTIIVESAEQKIHTGTVKAEYLSDNALSGVTIDNFDAYSDNFVGITTEQEDDDPDKYDCSVTFQNKSDFQMQLVNLDIHNALDDKKYIDIDPNEIPPIAAGAKWVSVPWVVDVENGEEPCFYKTVEFFLLADRTVSTAGSISIDDIELAVALLAGTLHYSITSIASFKEVSFNTLMQVKNIGGADLDSLIMEEQIQQGYIPPKVEEIELFVVRPPEDMTEEDRHSDAAIAEAVWEDLGEPIEIDSSLIEITPNDQEPTAPHTLKIKLENLRDSPIGMVIPGMIVRAKYPLKAFKIPKGEQFTSNVTYTANTFPAGSPIVITPEAITIPVLHIRRKTVKGKEVKALAGEGAYEIGLFLENVGEFDLENVVIKDVVPHNFEYSDISLEPTKYERMDDKDLLIWEIAKVATNEKVEIKYKINGKGDYKASDAQFSV